MNMINNCVDSFIEVAIRSKIEQKNPSYLIRLKNCFVQFIDKIFAYFSAAYNTKYAQISDRILVDLTKKTDHPLSPQVEKINQVAQNATIKVPPVPKQQTNIQEAEATIASLVDQQLHEDEIVTIMKDAIPEDQCKAIIAKLKQRPANTATYPTLILAANGVNQYQAGGVSACTPLACKFIASKEAVSAELLEKLIKENKYTGADHPEAETCIKDSGLQLAENPWAFQKDFSPSMQVAFERNGDAGLVSAVKSLVETANIRGAVFIANAVTIGMRKQGNAVEFFDSHGDNTITQKGNVAYVKAFANDQGEQILQYLEKRYPAGLTPAIEVWPIL